MDVVASERKFSWGAVWAGLFTVAAVQVLMQLFGLAIGFSIVSPTRGTVAGVNIWIGIWAIISTLSAFFFGGWVASLIERPLSRIGAVALGVVVWAFSITTATLIMASGPVDAIRIARGLLVPPGAGSQAYGSAFGIAAAWATFGTVLLALGCSVAGSVLGTGRREREVVGRRPIVTTPEGQL